MPPKKVATAQSTSVTSEVHPFPVVAKKTPVAEPAAEIETPPPVIEVKAPAAEPASAATAAPAAKKKSAGRFILPIIGLALVGAGAWYGYDYWVDGRFMVSTDDAYVEAEMAFISPKITGYVASRPARENQVVKAGDPLVVIDDGDYRIAREQVDAQIATLGKTLERIDAQIVAARASLEQAQAQTAATAAVERNAGLALDRASELVKTKVATQAQLDSARTAVDQAKAASAGASAQIAAATANIGVLEAQRAETQSTMRTLELTRAKADRDLSFTVLRAPYDGVVGNLSVEQGDLITPGQKLAVVVPMDKLYIVANFKETQLARLAPGEKVRITVDAAAHETFEGTVSSLAPASGAVFSMLPPENATGNFTKVVQRVPVRIDIPPEALKSGHLRAGLSVVVDVDSRTAPAAVAAN